MALHGGPALVLGHGPFFECEFSKATGKSEFPFHSESPAGVWADLHEEYFADTTVQFFDPFKGAGGFGASTAQFLAVYLYVLSRQNMLRNGMDLTELQRWAIVEDYRQLFEDEEVPPSGYDLMAQMQKGLSSINGIQQKTSIKSWPFTDLDIFIFKTSNKVNTHEHLKKLQMPESTVRSLAASVEKSVLALDKKDRTGFIEGVKSFTDGLQKAKWMAPATWERIQKWNGTGGVLASKGCGALGADVFVAFAEKSFEPSAELEKELQLIWSTREMPS